MLQGYRSGYLVGYRGDNLFHGKWDLVIGGRGEYAPVAR